VHAELIVPGLLQAPEQPRLPALELLLARARTSAFDAQDVHAWLGEAFGLASLPAGALTTFDEGFWLRADPVHLSILRDRLVLMPVQGLSSAVAEALVATLNRHFAGTHEFRAPHPDRWVMRAAPAALDTLSTAQMAGRDIDPQLPGGPWPALLNEIQMALHEHPANEGRELPVNSVWLWGAGTLPAEAAAPWRTVTAADPVAIGLARVAGLAHRAPPGGAGAWLAELPSDGRHLALLDGAHEALEAAWFAPLLDALRGGRLGMLTLQVPEAGLSFEVARGDLRRFWRRARAVASHAPG
jgi:hypothetical protein